MKKSVVLGNFDGVHIAHRILIEEAIACGNATAYIFERHPLAVLGCNMKLLSSNVVKKELIEKVGKIDVMFEPTTLESLAMSPEDFARDIIGKRLRATNVFAGYDYTFGKNGSGDIESLKNFGQKYGFEVYEQEKVCIDGERVSSSLIKEYLGKGDVERANKQLGYDFFVRGTIKRGKGLGRKLGFPTVNVYYDDMLQLPQNGVYLSKTVACGKEYYSITNVGTNPTVGAEALHTESFIIDFDGNIYGESVDTVFLRKIRDEKKFADIGHLSEQISIDLQTARKFI